MKRWLRRQAWFFGEWRWYRRWYGGVWERWHYDNPYTLPWFRLKVPSSELGRRPTINCLGTPIVEDYR